MLVLIYFFKHACSALAWTADSSPIPDHPSLAQRTLSLYNISLHDRSINDTNYAWALSTYAGATSPIFTPILTSDAIVGRPLHALCCSIGKRAAGIAYLKKGCVCIYLLKE